MGNDFGGSMVISLITEVNFSLVKINSEMNKKMILLIYWKMIQFGALLFIRKKVQNLIELRKKKFLRDIFNYDPYQYHKFFRFGKAFPTKTVYE